MCSPPMRFVALACLCVAFAGCATTPLDQLAQPAFELPARFGAEGEAGVASRWWTAFDDPGLNALTERALANNFTLASAFARVEQARATLASANADLFPSVDASVEQSATRRSNDGAGISGSTAGNNGIVVDGSGSNWSDTRTLQFSAAYELDVWGRLRNARSAAVFDARASAADYQAAAITLTADLASNWYQLQELRTRIALLEDQIQTNRDVLDLTTYSFTHGQAQAADVLRQRQAVESVRGQLEQTQASAAVVEHALATLVGVAPEHFQPPAGELIALPALPDTGVPAAALMRRPDVRQPFYALAAADRRVAVAVANRYPQLSLSASLSSSNDSGDLFSNWITQLAANLTQPIFDAGSRAAEVDRSTAVVAEEVADYQQSLLEALQETEDALANEYRQKRYLERLDEQLRLSRESVSNLRLRYLRGATDYLDVLDALLTRQNLQVDYLAGRRQLLDYRINLYRALAGDIDSLPDADIDSPPVPLRAAAEEDRP